MRQAVAGEPGVAADARWWTQAEGVRRFVSDLVAGELAQLRHEPVALRQPWPEDLALDQDLGVDSLELMALATALAEALHLHASGIEDYLLARRTLVDWVAIAQAGLARFDERLTFRTSGSTGVAKPCVHPLATLWQEARHLAALFPGRSRVLCAVPAHHIYGFLFTVLLPQALRLQPQSVLDIRGSTPAWLAHGARPGDLVIGHPDFWQAVGRTVPALPPGVIGVTSTAPCPDAVGDAVERAGIARLFHIYGSSETAGIGWRNSHREPYELFPYWSFAPGQSDVLVRRLPQGAQHRFEGQDRLDAVGERHFRVGPRHDAAVQVGGINVFPERVRSTLLAHPLVKDAAVRLMRADEGSRLKAFIVPAVPLEQAGELPTQLRAWIDAQLPVPERPKAIRLGTALPVSITGKAADWPAAG